MFNLNKELKIIFIATLLFIAIVTYIKIYSYTMPRIILFTYFFFCFFILLRHISRIRKKIFKNIEDNYPDLYKKLSSSLLGYDLGISSLRFSTLINFGPSTEYEEVNIEIKKYKQLNYKAFLVLFVIFFIIILSSVICKVT